MSEKKMKGKPPLDGHRPHPAQTEDRMFAYMRILLVAGMVLYFIITRVSGFAPFVIPNVRSLSIAFFSWSLLVTGLIFLDQKKRTNATRIAKRIFVGISLPVDGYFIYAAAEPTGGLHSPFFVAVFILIVFHAFYFPSYIPRLLPSRLRWCVSGTAAGLLVFISLYLLLIDRPLSEEWVHFGVDSFFALILSLTAGILRDQDRQTTRTLRRNIEMASLFRGIIQRVNQIYVTGAGDKPALDNFDDLAAIIGENLSAMCCEVFILEEQNRFIRKGLWIHKNYAGDGFNALARRYSSIDLGVDFTDGSSDRHRAGRYTERDARQTIDASVLGQKMADFLREKEVRHSLFTLILMREPQNRRREPIGIIRLTNRLDSDHSVHFRGFTDDDEEVIQTVAREISGAIETYYLQTRSSKIVEQERYLRELATKDDLDEIVFEILQRMSKIAGSAFAELWTPFEIGFERKGMLALRAHYPSRGHVLEKLAEHERCLEIASSVLGQKIFSTEKIPDLVFVDDLRAENDDSWARFIDDFQTTKFIGIPLLRGREPLGVVTLHPLPEFRWDREIQEQLRDVANLAAIGLENARYRRRFSQLNTLREGLNDLFVDDDNVFYFNICRLVKKVISAEACSLFEIDLEKQKLILRGSSDESDATRNLLGKELYSFEDSITGQVAKHDQPVVLYGEINRPGMVRVFNEHTEHPPIALMAAPLRNSKKKILGVVRCINKTREPNVVTNTFSNSDCKLLEFTVGILGAFQENRANLRELKRINQQRQAFLSSVAHEFTSPLQSIRTTAEYLKKFHRNPQKLKNPDTQFDFLIEEVDFLSYLSVNIRLQFAEGLYEFPESRWEQVDLFKLIQKIQTLLRGQARDKGLRIHLRGNFPRLVVDRFRLEQVVFNLLVNAIKYTPARTVQPIEIICQTEANAVVLAFRNWGIGVLMDERAKIFKMFERGSRAHAGSVTGTGLGLYISRKIIEDMGGNLELTRLENPTEFTVRIPKK